MHLLPSCSISSFSPASYSSSISITQSNLKAERILSPRTKPDYEAAREYGSVFSEEDWETFCGKVDPAPDLPHNIGDIWQSQCPVFQGKKVYETHILVYIPKTVNGKPLTLKSLGKIAKQYFPETAAGYRVLWDHIVSELGDQSIEESYWVLMTKDVLPDSRNESDAAQLSMVVELSKKALVPYEVPKTLEAAVCILAHYFMTMTFDISKNRLFSDNQLTYTRCQEEVQGSKIVVGGFALSGLRVYSHNGDDNDQIGIAALLNLSSSPLLSPTAPSTLQRCEWAIDQRHIYNAVNTAIGQTSTISKARLIHDLVKLIVSYLKSDSVFGPEEWGTFCGRVNPAPEIPLNIENIWQSQCPVFPEKRVCETHMLVLIPTTVDNNPLTLKSIGEIAKRYFPKTKSGYRFIWGHIVTELGDESIEKSYWVLMTKDVLPGSQNRDNIAQRRMVTELATRTLAPYKVPRTLEATVCILAQYFSSSANNKTRLFSDSSFTLCQEYVRDYNVIVGGFTLAGLGIYDSRYNDSIGVATLRKL